MEEHPNNVSNVSASKKLSSDGCQSKKAKLDKEDTKVNSNSIQHVAKNSQTKRNNNNSRRRNDDPDVQLSKSLSWLLRHTAPSLGLHPTPDGYIPVVDILSLNHARFRNGKNCPKYTIQDVRRVVENSDKQRFRLEYKDLSGALSSSNNQPLYHSNDSAASLDNGISSTSNNQTDDNLTFCIRANQGHSYKDIIESDKLLTPLTNEELSNPNLTIVHGTTRKAWEDHIRIEGLSKMKRNHIHFATGLPKDVVSEGDENKRREEKKAAPISGMRATSQIYIYINGERCARDGIKFFRSDNGVILTAGNDEGLLPVKYFKQVVLASSGKVLLDDDD
jgi:2'-phosphotransferase